MSQNLILCNPVLHFDDSTGVPLSGGYIEFYDAGTSITHPVYQDHGLTNPHSATSGANGVGVLLNSRGEVAVYGKGLIDFYVYDSSDVLIKSVLNVRMFDISNFMLTLLDDTTASAARSTLGLGTAATHTAGTSANNVLKLDSSGRIPAIYGSLITNLNIPGGTSSRFPRSYLSGLQFSYFDTITFRISAGVCRDSTNTVDIELETAFIKTTAAWAEGSGLGALDSGSVLDSTWYHCYVIYDSTNDNTDIMISTSASTPTMADDYDYYRRIFSFKTNGSIEITNMIQYGDRFTWYDPPLDLDNVTVTSTASLHTLSTPLGIQSIPIFTVEGNRQGDLYLYCFTPGVKSDETIITGSAPTPQVQGAYRDSATILHVLTNTNSQIYLQSGNDSVFVFLTTFGFIDRRGKDD